ncbi:MAG: type II secretion system protein N [Pseudomonadota bacterium]
MLGRILRAFEGVFWISLTAVALAYALYLGGALGAILPGGATTSATMETAIPTLETAQKRAAATGPSTQLPALFGEAPAPDTARAQKKPSAEPARPSETYSLQGVTLTSGQKWAMVQDSSGVILIREGDRLSDDETVLSIRADSVIFERDGDMVSILFPDAEPPVAETMDVVQASLEADRNPVEEVAQPRLTTVSQPKPNVVMQTREDVRPAVTLADLRRVVFAPEAMSSLRLERARLSDGVIGWRIKWLADNQLVAAAGLQRGDILRAVNDVNVMDATSLKSLLPALGRLQGITVDYERGDASVRAIIPLKKG